MLTSIDLKKVKKTALPQAWVYKDSSKHAKIIFDFYGIQFFSSFPFGNKSLYLIHWRDRTFLADITDSTISIVNPLFNDDLYTHGPVTTLYDKRILINLDFYGIAFEREISINYRWKQGDTN